MIKVNTHLSTEITDRRIRLSTKKYPFFFRTTWENYSSVYPLEYTCISISVGISCSYLFYIHVSFLSFFTTQIIFFFWQWLIPWEQTMIFSCISYITSYLPYVITILFSKKKNILTFYGCSRAHIASIILNTTCFIIIATTNSYQIRKEVFSFSINAICSSLYFAPRFRVLLLLDIIIIIRKKVSDCGCVFFIPFRVIFNLERS